MLGMKLLSFLLLIFASASAFGQATVRDITPTTSTPSGSCGATQIRLKTPTGSLYSCQNGTWALISGGGGGGATSLVGITDLQLTKTNSTQATVATGSSGVNNIVYTFAAAVATISAGSGRGYFYISSAGVLTVGHNVTIPTCTNCTATSGVTGFPEFSAPIGYCDASAGTWTSCTDLRHLVGVDVYTASGGVQLSGHDLSLTTTGVSAATYGSTTQIPAIVIDANGRAISASNVTPALPASAISSGTIATARLGNGPANSSTFLRGDQTYATPSGGSSTWPATLPFMCSVATFGNWNFLTVTTTINPVPTGANKVWAWAFYVRDAVTFTHLLLRIATAPTSSGNAIRYKIYSSDRATVVADSGALTGITTTGVNSVTVSSTTLTAGSVYYVAIATDDATLLRVDGYGSGGGYNMNVAFFANAVGGLLGTTGDTATGSGASYNFTWTGATITNQPDYNQHPAIVIY
jgi:hypothetical protein